jgi:hypothetical protein
MQSKSEFDESLINVVDEELKKIFGEMATLIIYGYLENNLSLKQEDIPHKIEVFAKGLDSFLDSGAKVIQQVIIKNLYANFGEEYKPKEDYDFVEYVNELKNRLNANP